MWFCSQTGCVGGGRIGERSIWRFWSSIIIPFCEMRRSSSLRALLVLFYSPSASGGHTFLIAIGMQSPCAMHGISMGLTLGRRCSYSNFSLFAHTRAPWPITWSRRMYVSHIHQSINNTCLHSCDAILLKNFFREYPHWKCSRFDT
jgi:hypothetical protein